MKLIKYMGKKFAPTKSTSTKTVPNKSISTKSNSKNFYMLLVILLITTELLIAVNIYCYWVNIN